MADIDESKRSTKELLILILWGLSPAILIALSGVGENVPAAENYMGRLLLAAGIVGMPFVLYPWSFYFLNKGQNEPARDILGCTLLTFVMCVANFTIGIMGCTIVGEMVTR